MIQRLIKKVILNGNETLTCVFYGTEKCRNIHNKGTTSCVDCPMMAQIMKKLYLYEEIEHEGDKD
jgi:hypothetical protein